MSERGHQPVEGSAEVDGARAPTVTRRHVLQAATVATAATTAGLAVAAPATGAAATAFQHGVASGDPLPDGSCSGRG